MAYFGVIFFGNMGGGGGQNYFQKRLGKGVLSASPVTMHPVCTLLIFFWCGRLEKLEKAGTVDFKKHPARQVGTRSRQCGPKVPGRFAFPGARNPRICSISRFGKFFSSNFPAIFLEFSSRTPEQTPETATAFSSFLSREGRKMLRSLRKLPKRQKSTHQLVIKMLTGHFELRMVN